MSYDLYFRLRDGKVPSRDEMAAWFARRPHYRVDGSQVLYDNDDSGVYFTFDLDGEAGPSFNLNYFRPSIFGLEAAPELAAFVAAFAFEVDDPQIDGMGEGPFSVEGFLSGWNHGNRFAYRAILQHHSAGPHLSLPEATHRRVWAWNRAREAYGDLLGTVEMIPGAGFVPRIFLLVDAERPTEVLRAVVWPEAMAAAMPEANIVLAMDTPDKAPRVIDFAELVPLFDRFERRGPDHAFTLDGQERTTGPVHWLLAYDEAPDDLVRAHQQGAPRTLQRVAIDQVLDRELLDAPG